MRRLQVLVIALLLTAVCAVGLAETVAKIGDNEYTTLSSAFSHASTGDTITLALDFSESNQVLYNKSGVTLDLKGKTYTNSFFSNDKPASIKVSGNLTIIDSAGTGKIVSTYLSAIEVGSGASVSIKSGSFQSKKGTITGSGAVTITGGTFKMIDGNDDDSVSSYIADGYTMENGSVVAKTFASGSGTETNPYVIETAGQLAAFAVSVNNGTSYAGEFIKLDENIVLTGEWTPIGEKGNDEKVFKGVFDGNEHEISGLSINGTGNYQALFGRIQGATIKDLTVSGSVSAKDAAGVVARMDGGTLENVISNVTVTATSKAGGVVCLTTGTNTIKNCVNNGTVTVSETDSAGGILGMANSATKVTGCTNTAEIKGGNNVGGIVAYVKETEEGAEISNCTNTGAVSTTSSAPVDRIGGILGFHDTANNNGTLILNENSNSGDVSGYEHAGGIVGIASAPTAITGNANTGKVTCRAAAGSGHVSFPAGIVSNAGATSNNKRQYERGRNRKRTGRRGPADLRRSGGRRNNQR